MLDGYFQIDLLEVVRLCESFEGCLDFVDGLIKSTIGIWDSEDLKQVLFFFVLDQLSRELFGTFFHTNSLQNEILGLHHCCVSISKIGQNFHHI